MSLFRNVQYNWFKEFNAVMFISSLLGSLKVSRNHLEDCIVCHRKKLYPNLGKSQIKLCSK